jgi:hypothetical protein
MRLHFLLALLAVPKREMQGAGWARELRAIVHGRALFVRERGHEREA